MGKFHQVILFQAISVYSPIFAAPSLLFSSLTNCADPTQRKFHDVVRIGFNVLDSWMVVSIPKGSLYFYCRGGPASGYKNFSNTFL
jgi:hypothetical protein